MTRSKRIKRDEKSGQMVRKRTTRKAEPHLRKHPRVVHKGRVTVNTEVVRVEYTTDKENT